MRTRPLSDALGVQLLDFDITKAATADEQAELRRLFIEHHLLLVRGQSPGIEDHNRFAAYFGPLSAMLSNGDTGYVSNKVSGGVAKKGGGPVAVTGTTELLWHADGTYGPHPGIGTSLLAIEVQSGATPTLFANCIRALERLPADLRARIGPLHAVHMRDTVSSSASKPWRDKLMPTDAEPGRIRSQEHPIVYHAPHFDRPLIFVNYLMTSHIAELEREEGDALLDQLYDCIYANDNVYTHEWESGDVIIWDNIALQHCRPSEMGSIIRHLRRLSLDGWNGEEGVIEWFATSTPRDLKVHGRVKEAANYTE